MVLERLKKALGLGKPVRETNVIKITPEILEKVEPILKKELGYKDAEIVRLKDKVNALSEELKKTQGKLETPGKRS